jgi:hypothetical protein
LADGFRGTTDCLGWVLVGWEGEREKRRRNWYIRSTGGDIASFDVKRQARVSRSGQTAKTWNLWAERTTVPVVCEPSRRKKTKKRTMKGGGGRGNGAVGWWQWGSGRTIPAADA